MGKILEMVSLMHQEIKYHIVNYNICFSEHVRLDPLVHSLWPLVNIEQDLFSQEVIDMHQALNYVAVQHPPNFLDN